MSFNELLKNKGKCEDINDYHIFRFLGAFIAVSGGKVIDMRGQLLEDCPLVKILYGDVLSSEKSFHSVDQVIQKKLDEFKFFTTNRLGEPWISAPQSTK